MAFKVTLGTKETFYVHTLEEGDAIIRKHVVRPIPVKGNRGVTYTEEVRQPDGTVKIEPAGVIEEVK